MDGLSPVTTKFFNFTVNFLGNYWCFWWTFYDTGSPPVRCCTCSVERGRGSISYFWHKFPPPISGPCHHQWPLWCSFNRMSLASEASCTLSAPLGWRWVNWTMTFLCMCVWGKDLVWKNTEQWSFICTKVSTTVRLVSKKMCSDDIYDV